jgi:hypothetical protein
VRAGYPGPGSTAAETKNWKKQYMSGKVPPSEEMQQRIKDAEKESFDKERLQKIMDRVKAL